MKEPKVIEIFADNGEHSHWQLIDSNGNILWSEDPMDMKEKCENCGNMVVKIVTDSFCPICYD